MCHYNGATYIAYGHFLDSVDKEGHITSIIDTLIDIDFQGIIWDIALKNDKIFVLNNDDMVAVYSLFGDFVTKWRLPQTCNRITASGDLLVLYAAYRSEHLLVYTEEGQRLRQINAITSSFRLCSVDAKSVIVQYISQDILCKVDMGTGNEIWRRSDIRACGAVYDGDGNLLVMDDVRMCVQILDIRSGKIEINTVICMLDI